jgi:hypothetical protein
VHVACAVQHDGRAWPVGMGQGDCRVWSREATQHTVTANLAGGYQGGKLQCAWRRYSCASSYVEVRLRSTRRDSREFRQFTVTANADRCACVNGSVVECGGGAWQVGTGQGSCAVHHAVRAWQVAKRQQGAQYSVAQDRKTEQYTVTAEQVRQLRGGRATKLAKCAGRGGLRSTL